MVWEKFGITLLGPFTLPHRGACPRQSGTGWLVCRYPRLPHTSHLALKAEASLNSSGSEGRQPKTARMTLSDPPAAGAPDRVHWLGILRW